MTQHSDDPLPQAVENIYQSLHNNNDGIDACIAKLKAILPAGTKNVTLDPARLPHANRQGRKLLQSYFKQRGVIVEFAT